jgi:hypothetical protein
MHIYLIKVMLDLGRENCALLSVYPGYYLPLLLSAPHALC